LGIDFSQPGMLAQPGAIAVPGMTIPIPARPPGVVEISDENVYEGAPWSSGIYLLINHDNLK